MQKEYVLSEYIQQFFLRNTIPRADILGSFLYEFGVNLNWAFGYFQRLLEEQEEESPIPLNKAKEKDSSGSSEEAREDVPEYGGANGRDVPLSKNSRGHSH